MAGTDNDWMVSDSNMYSIPPGNVGIGTTTPQEKLTVVDGTIKCTNSSDGGWAVQGEASGWYGQGVYGYGTGYGGRGVYGKAGEDFGMGVYGKAIAEGQVSNWGGYFSAAGDFGTGVYGHASASGDVLNFGGYFEAAGDQGRGVYGKGTGYGGYFIGDNDMVGQDSYGLYTEATGLEGDRYGLYSKVTTSNGPLNFNWGGYAEVANNDGGSVGYHADLTPGESGWGMSVGLHTTAANTDNQTGLYSSVSHRGTEGKVYGVLAATFSSDSGESYAGYFDSRSYPGDTGDLYGIKALCGNDTSGSKYAGYFTKDGGGNYAGYFSGNVHVSGTLTATSKPFIQPHKSDPSKEVVYASLEGPEHTVFIRGKAGCQNGVAVIKMPEYWQQVAAEHDITVNLTPMGAWAGLYVQSASNREVVVRVAGGGAENAQFCYYITAPRAGFEEHEPIQENTHFTADGTSAGDFESRYTEDTLDNKAIRAMLQANGILTADGKLNMDTVGRLGWTVNAENAEPILPKRHQFAHAAGVKY